MHCQLGDIVLASHDKATEAIVIDEVPLTGKHIEANSIPGDVSASIPLAISNSVDIPLQSNRSHGDRGQLLEKILAYVSLAIHAPLPPVLDVLMHVSS